MFKLISNKKYLTKNNIRLFTLYKQTYRYK